MNDFTWVFHASNRRGRVLRFLVERYAHDLEPLLPRVESDDPLARLDAELRAESECDEAIAEEPGLGRFFPPALPDADEAGQFRRHAIAGQAQNRLEAGRFPKAEWCCRRIWTFCVRPNRHYEIGRASCRERV